MASFAEDTNMAWMEALDVGSSRLYFIKLDNNETSWECPPGFLVRKDLVRQHAKLLQEVASGGGGKADMDDAAFLARVRERFPPPAVPPPGEDATALQARVAVLEQEKATLQAALAEAGTQKAVL